MKIKSFIVPALACLMALSSCKNDPLSKKYNEATLKEDIVDIKNTNKLDNTELTAMAFYMAGAKFRGKNLEGKTYKEILDSARVLKNKWKN